MTSRSCSCSSVAARPLRSTIPEAARSASCRQATSASAPLNSALSTDPWNSPRATLLTSSERLACLAAEATLLAAVGIERQCEERPLPDAPLDPAGTAGLGRFFAFCDRAFCIGAAVDDDRDIAGERVCERWPGDALEEGRPGAGLPLAGSNPMGAAVARGGRAGGPERSAIRRARRPIRQNQCQERAGTQAARRAPVVASPGSHVCHVALKWVG